MCELEVLVPMHTCGSLRTMSGVFLHAPLRSPLRQGLLLNPTPVSSQDLPVSTQPLWGKSTCCANLRTWAHIQTCIVTCELTDDGLVNLTLEIYLPTHFIVHLQFKQNKVNDLLYFTTLSFTIDIFSNREY